MISISEFGITISGEGLRLAASVYEPESGRMLKVYSDMPGLQFFTPAGFPFALLISSLSAERVKLSALVLFIGCRQSISDSYQICLLKWRYKVLDKHELDEHLRQRELFEFIQLTPPTALITGKNSLNYITPDFYDFMKHEPTDIMMNKHESGKKIENHKHNNFEMMFVYDGSITHNIEGTEVLLKKGDCLILAPDTYHSIDECRKDDIAVNFIMRPELFGLDFMQFLSNNPLLYEFLFSSDKEKKTKHKYIFVPSGADPDVYHLATSIMCEMYDPDISSTSSIKAMLIVMLNLLFRIWKQNGGVIEPRSEMDTVDIWEIMRYMELHCKDVSLSEVAFRFGYNIFYLSKLIKKRTGHNFTELKQRACIEYAKNMLVTSNVPIQEIAIQSGFSNITHFYTVFKKYFSITPADYRRDFLKESPKPVKL